MNKIYILIVFLVLGSKCFSQNNSIDKIELDEIVLKETKKRKIINYKNSGRPAFNSISFNEGYATKVNNPESGLIKSVTFFLNCGLPNLFKKKLEIKYADTKIKLIVFEIDSIKNIFRQIETDKYVYLVKKDHSGSFKVDLSDLNLTKKSYYIGFEVINLPHNEGCYLYVRLNESENYESIHKSHFKSNKWLQRKEKLKMKYQIEI